MIHSDLCIDRSTYVNNERAVYLEAWPNHCKTCLGWGGDHAPYDVTPEVPGAMPGWKPCAVCVQQGLCPRCGEALGESYHWCAACGWDVDVDNGLLLEWICPCNYEETFE